ncbi:MAG: glycosyltransferase family 2 protein [Spirochaetaceae bacterium]|nr:MAG: glycosyltransferase family 2 protein [Spirochaetaceae bacterium]
MKDSVSVVIPVYNRFGMLLQALESVCGQTAGPREIVVVDDGSRDIDAGRLTALRALDPRIDYLRIAHCGMPGAVRNAGAARCSGEWIALLDCDDIWHPDKLALQLECAAANPSAPLVHTRERWLRDGREIPQTGQRHLRTGWVFADALVKCTIGPSTAIMRRALYSRLGGFRSDMEVAEDYEFWLRVTARYPVAYVDRPLVDKRAGHGDQLSEKHGQIERFRIEGLLRLVEQNYFSFDSGLQALARAELARKCAIYAAGAAKRGRHAEADRFRALARGYSAR